jgi:hypothetical protein
LSTLTQERLHLRASAAAFARQARQPGVETGIPAGAGTHAIMRDTRIRTLEAL